MTSNTMYILNEAHFKGTAEEIQKVQTTIENLAIGVDVITTYTDRVGRVHLLMEFETEGLLDSKTLNQWQQVEISLQWIPTNNPGAGWQEWKPALLRAKERWNL